MFFIQENVAFIHLSNYQLHNQLLQPMNNWWKVDYLFVFGKTLTSITLPFTLFESHYWQVHCHPWQTKFIFNPLCVQRQDNEVYFCMNLYHPAHFAAIIVFIFFWDASAKRIFCWCTPSGMPRRQALSRSWSHPLFLECQDVLIFKNMAAKNAGCPKNMEH